MTVGFLVTRALPAHLTISDPPDRAGNQKEGPCEGQARGSSPRAYTGGETVTIKWTETVEHGGGFFRISLDPAGDKFDANDDGTADYPKSKGSAGGNGDDALKLLDVPDRDVKGEDPNYSADITLPNIDCDQCALQVIQMMGDKEPSANDPTNHIYFRCADITITKSDPPAGGAGAMPSAGAGGMPGAGAGGMPSAGAGGMPGAGGMLTKPVEMKPAPPEPMEPAASAAPVVPGPDAVPPPSKGANPPGGASAAGPGTSGESSGTGSSGTSESGGCAIVSPPPMRPEGILWVLAAFGAAWAWRGALPIRTRRRS